MSVYIKEPNNKAQACIIWMHGLGASARDMMGLADQLPTGIVNVRHVFIDAPPRPVTINHGMVMPAWYDILGKELTDREDKPGIAHSANLICGVMEEQIKDGFLEHQIYLAGFSQGGAMALHTGLHHQGRLGGVIALSAYLPVANETTPILNKSTPFFMALGQFDPVVLPQWTQKSQVWLTTHGYDQLSVHTYPMEHSICYEELQALSGWLIQQVQGGAQ